MSSSRLNKIKQPPEFFKRHYDKIVLILIALIVVTVILAGGVMYQVFHRPLPQFHAQSADGQVISLTPSDAPILLSTTLLRWANKAAVAAYTFDFVNYAKQTNDAHPYFTQAGWNDYQASIGGLIQTIKQNQLFVTGVVVGAPVISNQGELPGVGYAWRVQMPFLVTYQSSEQLTKTSYTMILTIVRVPTRVNPQGIGIDQLVME